MASAFVPESAGSGSGDDDKVYFFFSERAVEYDCYAEQVVARVARVCKVRGHLGTHPELSEGCEVGTGLGSAGGLGLAISMLHQCQAQEEMGMELM